jgi:hypothetical protein
VSACRLARVSAALAVMALAASALATAQTRPVAPPPVPTGDSAVGTGVSTAPPQPPRAWVYSLGVGAGWESNVGLAFGSGQGDFGGVGQATLSRRFRGAKGELTLSGRALGYVYDEMTEHNSLNGDVRLSGQRRLGTNSNGSLDLSVSSDQSYNTGILIEQGSLLPATRVTTWSATGDVRRRVSERNSVRFAAFATRLEFAEAMQREPSDRLRMSLDFDRRMGLRDNLTFAYSAEVSNDAQLVAADGTATPRWWSHYFSAQWSRRFSARTGLLVEGGTSYTPMAVEAGLERPWSFFGGLSLDHRVGSSTVMAYYRREVIPVFGTGQLQLADRGMLNLNAPFGGRYVLSLGGAYTGSSQPALPAAPDAAPGDPLPAGERQATLDAFGTLSARVSRRLWLSANGRFLHQTSLGTLGALEDARAALLVVVASPGSTPSLSPWR